MWPFPLPGMLFLQQITCLTPAHVFRSFSNILKVDLTQLLSQPFLLPSKHISPSIVISFVNLFTLCPLPSAECKVLEHRSLIYLFCHWGGIEYRRRLLHGWRVAWMWKEWEHSIIGFLIDLCLCVLSLPLFLSIHLRVHDLPTTIWCGTKLTLKLWTSQMTSYLGKWWLEIHVKPCLITCISSHLNRVDKFLVEYLLSIPRRWDNGAISTNCGDGPPPPTGVSSICPALFSVPRGSALWFWLM